ncbi:UDP-glycosyltransferase 90A1 [Zea mays]|nr:UDP-glycosyltransferase 90A1 [Zea mays]|eukprot:XP_008670155.2 UDP-glycosyltransferase 90A1 [Zea mays]
MTGYCTSVPDRLTATSIAQSPMASSAPAPASTLPCSGAHDAQAELPHIVIFPFMLKSHTIPLTDLAHQLRRRQMATVTFLTTPGNAAFVRAALAGADSVAIVELPFADNLTKPGAPPRRECVETLDLMSSLHAFVESVSLLRPQFEEALAALRPPASAVVADAFLYWAHTAAAARGVPTLSFFGMNMFAHFTREVFVRDNPASVLTRGTPDPDAVFTVPEFPDVRLALADIPFPFNDPATTGPTREMDAKIGHAIASSHGLIVNTFDAMEGRYIQHWNRHIGPRAWPVGPLCLARTAEAAWHHGDVAKPAWMRWLDEKAAAGRAVLYVALGTTLAVESAQLREVADGLDRAGLDFIWAVRPVDADLGAGFEERVRGRGEVVRGWVDQRAILAHECVKGFLSHCGWNSVLESISAGVPLAVWPMGAEQPVNAKLVVDELGVGIRVPPKSDAVSGMARSEQIARVTSDLMTGETGAEAARKMSALAAKAREAVAEAGSSWRAAEELIGVLSKGNTPQS